MKPGDQGASHDRYTVVPRTLVFLLRGERVLLLKGAPTKRLWANKYNGLGGHVERGEDVLSAARRELREEARLEDASLHLVGIVTIDTGQDPGVGLFVFRGEAPEGWEPSPSPEGQPEWVPVTELTRYPLVEDLRVVLPRVLAWQPDAPPFFALYTFDAQGQLRITFG
ncbi:MAG TPA: NUDIX domain-containing protein [Anaerolineae bacterium]|nr:NUDIX domain-containing protein [Anaerolineae bacterium]HID84260.1 NUDIX domain-containing protein [Anaerolineales bacterium]HIQ09146.1 NUDIX domain-containing protein [Anaerolineaceae bacterium]